MKVHEIFTDKFERIYLKVFTASEPYYASKLRMKMLLIRIVETGSFNISGASIPTCVGNI